MGRFAKGSILKIGGTDVWELRDLQPGGLSMDNEDVTHHGSAMKEITPTVLGYDEVTFQVNSNPLHATQTTAGIRGNLIDKTLTSVTVVVPAATSTGADVLAMSGFFLGMTEPSAAVSGAMTRDIRFMAEKTVPTWTTQAALT